MLERATLLILSYTYIQLICKNKWEYWHYVSKQIPIFHYLERNQYGVPSVRFSTFRLLFIALFDANLNLDFFSTAWNRRCSSAQCLKLSLNKETENRLKIFRNVQEIFSRKWKQKGIKRKRIWNVNGMKWPRKTNWCTDVDEDQTKKRSKCNVKFSINYMQIWVQTWILMILM